jgi:hypothetical protein
MNTYWKTITPEIAKQLLEFNTSNRPLTQSWINDLAKRMSALEWKENGESIKFNGTTLIDGQHRLLACIKSGVPFHTLVVDGIDSNVFDSIDQGKKRSGADTLAVRGEKQVSLLASSLAFVDLYKRGFAAQQRTYSNQEIQGLLIKYPTIRDSLKYDNSESRSLASPTIWVSSHYLFKESGGSIADTFINQAIDGVDLIKANPIFLLRSRLISNAGSKARVSRKYMFALFIKAWNAWKFGRTPKILKWVEGEETAEDFPVIL